MLYCDVSGKVYSSIMSRRIYERARENVTGIKRRRLSFATVGLETTPGQFVPAIVEVSQKEVWALERILEHALKNGKLPDILKKQLKTIIRRKGAEREALLNEHKKRRHQTKPEPTPRVLERLPNYPEEDMEVSMPIYKAEYSYPLIVLKILVSDTRTSLKTRKLLILDSDGDMAVIEVPTRLVRSLEMELAGLGERKRGNTCTLISKNQNGYTAGFMSVSRAQKKSLDTLTRYFEETGGSKERVSLAVRSVITRAKDRVSSGTD